MGARPRRKRQIAERVRTVDASEVQAAHARRLEALEADADDSWNVGQTASDDEYVLSDEELKSSNTLTSKKKRTRRATTRATRNSRVPKKPSGIEKWNKPLQVALEEDWASGVGNPQESYDAIAAKPSARPAKHLCSVCGFPASYTCTRCAVRFCSVRCGTVHEETRCLKFTL